jgi:hypothetical protein
LGKNNSLVYGSPTQEFEKGKWFTYIYIRFNSPRHLVSICNNLSYNPDKNVGFY